MYGGRRKKIKYVQGGVGEKIKICEGGSAKFSIPPPPIRISNGIVLTVSYIPNVFQAGSATTEQCCPQEPAAAVLPPVVRGSYRPDVMPG